MTNFKSYLPGNPKLFRLLALIIAFCLPLTKKGIPLLIVMLVLLRIWQYFAGDKGAVKPNFSLKLFSGLCLAYYGLHLLGMLWTENIDAGKDELEYKLSFLVIPLLFIFRIPYKDKFVRLVSFSFVAGMLCFAVFALIRAAFRQDEIGISAWFYSELSGNFHTSYVALYACWAVILITEIWAENVVKYWYYWISALFLLFLVVLLASKAGFLTAILTTGMAALFLFRTALSSPRNWLYIVSSALLLCLGALFSPSLNQRLAAAGGSVSATNQSPVIEADSTQHSQGSTNLRLAAMQAGFNFFLITPMGAGTGDLDLAMAEEYRKMNQIEAGEKQLNPHNQYLSTAVALGWPGLLILLAILFYPAWVFFKTRKIVWLTLPLITAFNLLFESMLEQQAGIVFFVFFTTILLAEPDFQGKRQFPASA